MLQLKEIKKSYKAGDQDFPALNGIDLIFKKNEFVSILGASGSGKTTLLNIIGGLDRYSSGDLIINNKSTKQFKDSDWDGYRNSDIGFVFQNYNLISHLSVLDNVEMALRLSGVSSTERKERAKKVLTEVGLADHIHKRPNQLSGGQMQRVAIARALVNNPSILLADEPTGALDSHTSDSIMKLIQEISKDRLVIMVTHNAEIANKFSDRIIRLVDGRVVEDTKPAKLSHEKGSEKYKPKKVKMSFITALKTSFQNLLTKKSRTIITMIAGSIGIIGVALVLSISTGMTRYVNELQSDALAGFPLTIQSAVTTVGPGSNGGPMSQFETVDNEFPTGDVLYSFDEEASTVLHTNLIDDNYISYIESMDTELYNSISYSRSLAMNVLVETSAGGYNHFTTSTSVNSFFSGTSTMSEIPDSPDFIQSQYDILAGDYPTSYNEVVLVVSSSNQITTEMLNLLGVPLEDEYTFSDFIGIELKVIPNDLYYQQVGSVFIPSTDYSNMYQDSEAVTLNIVGILRVSPDATSELLPTGLNYTTALTDYMLNIESTSSIVEAQEDSTTVNILTGTPFNDQITYDTIMKLIGGDSTPTGIQIYPVSFDAKDDIKAYLDEYNVGKTDEEAIIYVDAAETISSTISSLINTITIVLAAFAGISLVVSSIMIGIITYVSVIERTKEIGIMRSLGARKLDISNIFNAETLLIGLFAGIFGIAVTWLLTFPVNSIVFDLIQVENISVVTWYNSLALISLSAVLTLIAGLFPSWIAAKKDPVEALRTE